MIILNAPMLLLKTVTKATQYTEAPEVERLSVNLYASSLYSDCP